MYEVQLDFFFFSLEGYSLGFFGLHVKSLCLCGHNKLRRDFLLIAKEGLNLKGGLGT